MKWSNFLYSLMFWSFALNFTSPKPSYRPSAYKCIIWNQNIKNILILITYMPPYSKWGPPLIYTQCRVCFCYSEGVRLGSKSPLLTLKKICNCLVLTTETAEITFSCSCLPAKKKITSTRIHTCSTQLNFDWNYF